MGKPRRAPRAASPSPRRPGPLTLAATAALLLLAGTAEERMFGLVTDEAEVLHTAVSMATQGEIGIGRGERFLVPRPEGDAVSPYGMGLALVEVPAVLLAPAWEASFGAGTSQTLFVGLMVLLVWGASLGAGLLARRLGASDEGAAFALLACAIASPLAGYTGTGYSEPLQAVCLVSAALLAAGAARDGGTARAAGAGFAAGFAVLVKSVNLAVAPFTLLPLVLDGSRAPRERIRLLAIAVAGAAAPLAAWLAFEITRFGKPLSSYAGQSFNHPVLDGLWRLLVGPNEGLLLYFPLLAAAVAGLLALAARRESLGSALATAAVFGALLLISSAWFAWDGTGGWGPRFLVPAVPLLAAAAGAWMPPVGPKRLAVLGLGLLGAGVNVIGIFESDTAGGAYISSTPGVPATEEHRRRFPPYYLVTERDGTVVVPRNLVAASDPAFAPIRTHAFLLQARLAGPDAAAVRSRISTPPWASERPGVLPSIRPVQGALSHATIYDAYLTEPFRWPRLGAVAAESSDRRPFRFNAAYRTGLLNQTLRNLAIERPERALVLARRLWALVPFGYHAALVAEAHRAAGRAGESAAFLDALDRRYAGAGTVVVVRALLARDRGDAGEAARLMEVGARLLPTPALRAAAARPPSDWPKGLGGFLVEDRASSP